MSSSQTNHPTTPAATANSTPECSVSCRNRGRRDAARGAKRRRSRPRPRRRVARHPPGQPSLQPAARTRSRRHRRGRPNRGQRRPRRRRGRLRDRRQGARSAPAQMNTEPGAVRRPRPVPRPRRRSSTYVVGRGLRTWLRAFWIRAYREGITGSSPGWSPTTCCWRCSRLRCWCSSSSDRCCSRLTSKRRPARPAAALSGRRAEHAAELPQSDPGALNDNRRRCRARRDLDRHLVLGRHGHRLLPHLPRRVPRLGRAESASPSGCSS